MAIQANDNTRVNSPKAMDDRQGKFVAGVWQPFDSVADANTRIVYKYKTLTVPILVDGDIVEYWYKNGTTNNDLVPKNPRTYSSRSSLASTTDRYENGAIIKTQGYYTPDDGGAATYVVRSTPLGGLVSGNTAQISLPGGKYAVLSHEGSVNMEQFGAKGDGVTNDYNALYFANNFKQVQSNLGTIFGTPTRSYYLSKQSAARPNAGSFSWDLDCFLRINYSGVTWDGRGAKLLWDMNSTQSRVYAQRNGQWHVYRCKFSNINQFPIPNNMGENSWYDYYWQMMEFNVTPDGTYPYWDSTTQYYGGTNFCHIGHTFDGNYRPMCENITFKNWDISGMETDEIALDSGMWNIFTKGFNIQYYYDNILYENIKLHHIVSEMFYGGAESQAGRQTIKGCKVYMGHNGISGGGFPFYIQDNIFEDLSANAIENFPFEGKLVITGNDVKRCGNGFTIGGPGNDLQVQGDVSIQDNRIEDCETYGVYFSGRARGVNISNNILYDTGLSFYMLSNLGFPMVASEYMISNNQIYSHKRQVNFGIAFNSSSFENGNTTTNIFIKGNVFGSTSLKDIMGYPGNMGTAISFYGDLYQNIVIDGNSFIGKVGQYYEYVVKNQNFSPIFGKNFYRTVYTDHNIKGTSGGTYDGPTTIDQRYIFGDNYTYQLGTVPPGNGWGTVFFSAPPLKNISYRTDCQSVYIGTFYSNRVVLLPSGLDNLKRAFIMVPTTTNVKQGVRLSLIQSNNALETVNEVGQRSWEYQGLNDSIKMPDAFTLTRTEYVFGNMAEGEERIYDFGGNLGPMIYNPTHDQYFFDRDVANNFLAEAGIDIISLQVLYSGSYYIQIVIKNNSGVTKSLDGKNLSLRLYPVSKPTSLPTNIAPLREEGLTNMRPTGDVPHRFLFRDVQTNEYLEYNRKNGTWTAI